MHTYDILPYGGHAKLKHSEGKMREIVSLDVSWVYALTQGGLSPNNTMESNWQLLESSHNSISI